MKAIISLACIIGVVTAACGAPPRQYTLQVDLSDHSRTRLCSRDVSDDRSAGRDGKAKGAGAAAAARPGGDATLAEETCQPFAAQPLTTPGTLTVKLMNPSPQSRYDLRVQQFTREASPTDAQQIVSRVVQNIADVGKLVAGPNSDVAARAAAAVKDQAPLLAAAVIGAPAANQAVTPPPRPAPAVLFKPPYFDPAGKRFLSADASRAQARSTVSPDTNAPVVPYPPPRAIKLGDGDLVLLQSQGITADQLAGFVLDWCSAPSFVANGQRARYDDLEKQPDVDGLRRAFGITGKDVAVMLLGGAPLQVIADRVKALSDEAKDWTRASSAAKTYALMALGKTLSSDLANCQANVEFLEPRVSPDERTRLEGIGASDDVLRLARNARRFASAFDEVFGPVLQQGLIIASQTLLLDATSSSTFTLEPGRLEFGVGELDGQGKRTEVASYKVGVRGIERLAIVVGPAFTLCTWGCFDSIDQVARQPTMAGEPVAPIIDRSKKSYNFSLATAVHLTLWSGEDVGLGAVLGYPIGAAASTSSNFLVGAGLRFASGFELSAGVHGLAARALKSSYKTPIDLMAPGNQGLTIDSVTEDRPQLGIFVMFGFAPALFSSNKD